MITQKKLPAKLSRLTCLVLFIFSFVRAQPQSTFTDVTSEAGIDHQFGIYEGFFGGGACVLDFNNDGFEDLYLTGGINADILYQNNGNGKFTNVFKGSGLEIAQNYVTQGAVSADVNKDGWVDLFITTISVRDTLQTIPRAINLLFLNNGNSTFRNATTDYGLDKLYSFSTGAGFGDVNADGYPDLYVGNYFLEYDGPLNTISDATIVNSNSTAKGYLLLNKKGRYFEDGYSDYGLDHRGFGFGGLFTDFDNDGDQDLYVLHDFGYKATPNMLLKNNYPERSFTDVGTDLGMDLKINAMAAAVGDYDNNGLMDYFVTNIRFNNFMVSMGNGKPYTNKLKELGMHFLTISWGANFADFDHDGDLDLFVANGDLNPNCVPMGNFYFKNDKGQFKEEASNVGLKDYGIGRGSVVFDLENDGDLDILVVNQKPVMDYPVASVTRLFRNDLSKGNWIKIALKGKKAESWGLGSRVKVVAGNQRMIREIDGGSSSHISQNSPIAHFGLGEADKVDSIIVRWTGGKEQILTNQKVNALLTIVEQDEKDMSSLLITGLAILIFFILFSIYKLIKRRSLPFKIDSANT